jgi:predicted negative regulator of RcsB-dependent stress response
MFLLGKIKMLLIMTVIFGVLGFGAWKYYQYTQQQILIYATNAAQAEQAAEESNAAMEAIKQDLEQVQKQFNEVSKEFAEAQSRVDTLEKKLSKHDLGQLAQAKPGLVEKIIDKAGSNVMRCIEILSGAELTEEELNATKKSQVNNECPRLANPNYKP